MGRLGGRALRRRNGREGGSPPASPPAPSALQRFFSPHAKAFTPSRNLTNTKNDADLCLLRPPGRPAGQAEPGGREERGGGRGVADRPRVSASAACLFIFFERSAAGAERKKTRGGGRRAVACRPYAAPGTRIHLPGPVLEPARLQSTRLCDAGRAGGVPAAGEGAGRKGMAVDKKKRGGRPRAAGRAPARPLSPPGTPRHRRGAPILLASAG